MPMDTAKATMDFIESKGIELVTHPPYSPDLAPADFWLFPTVKKALTGCQFDTLQDVTKG